MAKYDTNSGFSIVEALLLLVIIGILGFTGWYVYHAKQTSGKDYTIATQSTIPASPYAGWKTGSLQFEQVSYQYPSNWTVTNISHASNLTEGCVTPGYDNVVLTSQSGHQVQLRTGVSCIGDGGAKAYGSVAVKSLGQNGYLVLENTPPGLDPDATGPAYACLSQTATATGGVFFGNSKHISDGGSPGPLNQFCYYPYDESSPDNDGPVNSTVATIEGSADFKTAKLIFESMKYTTASTASQSTTSTCTLGSQGITFACPSDFTESGTANGVTLESSDYQSESNFLKISSGSALIVSYNTYSVGSDTDASLISQAANVANGAPTTSKFITVAGLNAIEFTDSAGEDANQHFDVLFMKGNQQYLIDQQFKLSGPNPYPELVGSVASSFKFNS